MRRVALKRLCHLVTDPGRDFQRHYVALEHVASGTGRLIDGAELPQRGPGPGAAAVKPGDVLFGKLRPYLAKTLRLDEPMFASTELLALRPLPSVDSRWLHYLVMSNQIVGWAVATSDGSKMPRTSWSALGRFKVTLPDLRVQRAIADFLDSETTRIDTLIAKKRRLIELVSSRVWRDFETTVDALDAKHMPLRRCIRSIHDGPFGSAFRAEDYSESGAFVVRLGNIGFGELRDRDKAFIPLELYSRFLRHRVRAGDLLIAGLGDENNHAGRACVAPDLGRAIVKGKCFCAQVDKGEGPRPFPFIYLLWAQFNTASFNK